MLSPSALKIAVDLMNVPSHVHSARSIALPEGVSCLLAIVAGDEKVLEEAVQATGRSPEFVKEAAAFYIEQILLQLDADSYRILGAGPQATSTELRANMALLVRWLHPDHDPDGMRVVYVSRVTGAWNDLKTEERRAAYDRKQKLKTSSDLSKKRTAQGNRSSASSVFRKTTATGQARRTARPRRRSGAHARAASRRIVKRRRLGLFRKLMLLFFNRTIR